MTISYFFSFKQTLPFTKCPYHVAGCCRDTSEVHNNFKIGRGSYS